MNDASGSDCCQLLGLYDSPFTRRVAITLTLYGMPFEHLSLSVFRQMDAMRPLNPLFKVPMLTLPDGEKLYESAHLLDYLDELAADRGLEPLTPRAGPARRRVLQTVALAIVATEKAVAIEYERKRPLERQWPDWTSRLRGQMRQALAMLEEQLATVARNAGGASASDHFLVGGRLTQADISTAVGIGFVRYVLPHEWPADEYPALAALAARLEASDAFRAVPIDQ
ncbi:MAG: glutathione S-transferase family protein [Rhodobacteraceae bacterium]|nr:glutathione S-transferase family protein [Paracoccaceae bacterium]